MKKQKISTLFIALMLFTAVFSSWAKGTKEEGAATKKSANPLIKEEFNDRIICYNYDGSEVTIHKNPKRTIINYTSLVGLWYFAGGKAIGRPGTKSLSRLPKEAINIATTGHVSNPNTEKIISLKPDLVILVGSADTHRNLKEVLDQNGIENILLYYDNYNDFENIIDLFARINGDPEITNKIVPGIKSKVEAIISKTENKPRIKFLSLFASTRTFTAETNKANTARMTELLGGENIVTKGVADSPKSRVTFSMERIVERDPDIILITTMGDIEKIKDKLKKDLMSDAAWGGLRAVKEGRVYFLPTEYFLYKPNEKFPEAFDYLARLMYGKNYAE